MLTNELKKGARIQLCNGWMATIMDNARGNTRMCEVEGDYTETGSVYSHDIMYALINLTKVAIDYTPAQLKLRAQLSTMGF